MKKLLSIFLSALCLFVGVCFAGCNNEIQFNKEYKYYGVTFKKSEDLTIEDLSSFIPTFGVGSDVKTVADFEKMLKDNLDIARTGKKFLVERKQLEDFLRNNIWKMPLSQQNVIRGINCNILFSSYYTIIDSMVTILIQTY